MDRSKLYQEMIIIHIENSLIDEIEAGIKWINRIPAIQTGATPLASLAAPCHLEGNASHHVYMQDRMHTCTPNTHPTHTCMHAVWIT